MGLTIPIYIFTLRVLSLTGTREGSHSCECCEIPSSKASHYRKFQVPHTHIQTKLWDVAGFQMGVASTERQSPLTERHIMPERRAFG